MKPPEDIDQVLNPDILTMSVGQNNKSTGEELLIGDDVSGPIEGVAAVVDGAAALGLLVNGAEKLPL